MAVAPPVLNLAIDFAANPTAGHADILQGQDGVTSFWRLNNIATMLDSVGSNNGVIEGTPTTTTSPLTFDADPALAFDGTSDAAYVPTAANLTSKANFTVSGWLYLPSLPAGTRDLVAKRGAWLLQVDSTGHLIATLKDDTSTAAVTTNSVLATATFPHIALTYDSVNISIYINGVLDNQVAYTAGWEAGFQPIRFAASPSTAVPTWQSSTTNSGTSTSAVGNTPASTGNGDLLLAHVHAGSGTTTVPAFTPPAGWTLLGIVDNPGAQASATRVYYKIAGGSEPGSYTWTLNVNSTWVVAVTRVTGQDTFAPIANPPYSNKTSGTSHSTGAHIPDVDNNMVLAFFSIEDNTTWTESSGTERYDAGTGSNRIAMCSQTQASAAAITVTGTSGTSDAGSAIIVIVGGAGRQYVAASYKDWSFENVARTSDELQSRYESRSSGLGTYTGVTSAARLASVKLSSRQYERNAMEAGTSNYPLNDPTRKIDPSNQASPLWPNVIPNRRIRSQATFGGVTYPIAIHFIDRYPLQWDVPGYASVDVSASDAFKILNLAGVSGILPVGFSGEQIDKLLDKALWPQAARAIDAGTYVMAAAVLADGTKAKSEIDTIVASEGGLFFIDESGIATYHDAAHRGTQTRSTTSQATFTDSGGEIAYHDLQPSYDETLIVNDWIVSPDPSAPGAATQEALDHLSIAKFGRITSPPLSTRLASNADALSRANALLNETAFPALRFDYIVVKPSTTLGWQKCLSLRVSDRVTVVCNPVPAAGGTPISKDCFIEGKSIAMTPDGLWVFTFPLSPVSSGNYYGTIVRGGPISYWRDNTVA